MEKMAKHRNVVMRPIELMVRGCISEHFSKIIMVFKTKRCISFLQEKLNVCGHQIECVVQDFKDHMQRN